MAQVPLSLVFKVTKQKPELITPTEPTPYEFKELSDIDEQRDLRLLMPGIQFYRSSPSGLDPVNVIKEALGKALVSYYPLAGRLREKEAGKLVVECNGEGIMFIEADADVTLAEFGEPLYPPFPCMEDLLYDFSNVHHFLDYPLFIIQVTRLKCGGFILAHKINHSMADASGLTQFMHAVADLARGAESSSIALPVWDRHLLGARNPPQVTCVHLEYNLVDHSLDSCLSFFDDVVNKFFFFGPKEIDEMRRLLPAHLKSSTTFEILTAFIWRSRTISMQFNPNDEVRLRFFVDVRHKFNPRLPTGYYGNAIATPTIITTANDLVSNPLEYALALIKSAKANVTEDYIKSLVDFLVIKGRPMFHWGAYTYEVSDVSRARLDQWDFGWGKALYGGPIRLWCGESIPGYGNYYLAAKNSNNESGTMVPMFLPRLAMDRFIEELNGCLSPVKIYEAKYN